MLQDDRRADGELITHHAHMHDQCARIVRTDQLHSPDDEKMPSESILLVLMLVPSRALAAQNGGSCTARARCAAQLPLSRGHTHTSRPCPRQGGDVMRRRAVAASLHSRAGT